MWGIMRPMPMRTPLLLVGLLLPLLTACGDQAEPTADPTAGSATTTDAAQAGGFDLPRVDALEEASDVRFHVLDESGEQVDLDWWTACLTLPTREGNAVSVVECSDGVPPADPATVGSPDEVRLAFDLPGWEFSRATFRPHGAQPDGDEVKATIERTGDRTFVVSAPDEPGDYDVKVFGRGPEGDAVTTFRWVVR